MNWWGKPKMVDAMKAWFFFSRFPGHADCTLLREFLGLHSVRHGSRLTCFFRGFI